MRRSWEYITIEATTDAGLNRQQRLQFHAFNPNGLYAQKKALDDKISAAVDAGILKSGWLLAYDSLNDYHTEKLMKLCNKKPSVSTVNILLRGLEFEIAKTKAKLETVKL